MTPIKRLAVAVQVLGIEVSILVLLDDSHQAGARAPAAGANRVSILVLLDDSHQGRFRLSHRRPLQVSILVLLDDSHQAAAMRGLPRRT